MKVFAWILGVFSAIACLGILLASSGDEASLWGLVYGGAVAIFCGLYLKEAYKK